MKCTPKYLLLRSGETKRGLLSDQIRGERGNKKKV